VAFFGGRSSTSHVAGGAAPNAESARGSGVRSATGATVQLHAGQVVTATAGPSRTRRARLLAHAPAVPQGANHEADADDDASIPRIPVDRSAPVRHGRPLVAPTRVPRYHAAGLSVLRTTDLRPVADGAGGTASLVTEPSVAANGNAVLETWNWGAAVSGNGGASFSYLDPYGFSGNSFGGFCCDQLAYYVPGSDSFVWVLQYSEDSAANNGIRVAVANSAGGLATGNFHYWDLTPQQLSGVPSGVMYDQPKIAATASNLYMVVSMYESNSFVRSVVLRLPLSTLAAGGSLTYGAFVADRFSPGIAQGAGSTMYLASHLSNAALRVYAWPDGASAPTSFDVAHSADPVSGPACPHGGSASSDWCHRGDPRINGGWVSGGVIGFDWTAPQGSGGLGSFPYPYAHVVRISESTHALIDEPILWNSSYAFAYPAVVANASGVLGASILYGGGSTYESCAVATQGGTGGAFWTVQSVAQGNYDTSDPKGGDYTTVRTDAANPSNWVAGCQAPVTEGYHTHPYFVSFSGGSGGPPPPPPPDTIAPTVRAYSSAGRHGRVMRLLFGVNDNSGEAAEALTIARGNRTIGRISIGFSQVDGSVYYVRWRAPRKKGALRFCLRARDRAGNVSGRSCAGLRIR
jgi:hypothetical protein